MRKWIVGIFLIIVALLILLVSVTGRSKPKKVVLEVIEGEVLVNNGVKKKTVKTNESLIAKHDRLEEIKNVPTENPVSAAAKIKSSTQSNKDSQKFYSLDVSLVDALGDSIQNGVIEIDGLKQKSLKSIFKLQALAEGKHVITACADGYREATAAIVLPGINQIAIQLEYLCDFEFVVRKGFEGNYSYLGAEVTLYEGPPVKRPVSDALALASGINLERFGNVIRVSETQKKWRIQSVGADYVWGNLTSGDVLYGFQKEYPLDVIQSQDDSVLRMWDSIDLLHADSRIVGGMGSGLWSSDDVGYMLFNKDGGYLFYLLARSNRYDDKKLVATKSVDISGKCRFTGLAPGLYFARADADGWQSEMIQIAPKDRTTVLRIPARQDVCTVRIRVTKSNVAEHLKNSDELYIKEAKIKLKGLSNHIILSPTSGWRDYVVHNVPVGDYRLEIAPPEKLNANPSFINKNIRVQERLTWMNVDFEVNYGYTLSGAVLVEGSKKPVPNFPLRLSLKNERIEGRYDFIMSTKSGDEGKFSFSFLTPGTYRISSNPSQTRDTGYIHVNKSFASRNAEMEDPQIPIVDGDVSGVVFPVVPYDTINVAGTVVRENGELVDGADVTLRDSEGRHLHSTSSHDGNFQIEICYPKNADPIQGLLIASIAAPKVQEYSLNDEGVVVNTLREYDNGYAEQGTFPLVLKSGDNVKDVEIVLKQADRGKSVYGKIVTSDGEIPHYVHAYEIYVIQDQTNNPMVGQKLFIHGTVNEDGTYRLDRLDPGPFKLRIDPANLKQDVGKYPPIPIVYAIQRFDLTMPDNVESLKYDIVLVEQSYIQGKLVDENGKPMTGLEILARVPYEPKGWVRGGDRVDENGAFLLVVSPEEEYDLYVSDPNRYYVWYEPILKNMKPPINGLIFTIRSDSAKKVVD